MSKSSPLDQILLLETELGIKKGFFQSLLKEKNDWTFVIKLHSLIEAAAAHLIATKIGKKELLDAIASMELSNNRRGKLAFLKGLGLLTGYRNFIKRFSELRNAYVHDISNVNLTIETVVEQNSELQKGLIKSLTDCAQSLGITKSPLADMTEIKFKIWLITLFMLSEIYLHATPEGSMGFLLAARLKKL